MSFGCHCFSSRWIRRSRRTSQGPERSAPSRRRRAFRAAATTGPAGTTVSEKTDRGRAVAPKPTPRAGLPRVALRGEPAEGCTSAPLATAVARPVGYRRAGEGRAPVRARDRDKRACAPFALAVRARYDCPWQCERQADCFSRPLCHACAIGIEDRETPGCRSRSAEPVRAISSVG